ncbi:MAG: hypothetical protein CM1200mP40_28690 [Gammaproteobacteria bacterium]|nr:MAG: hypothetical protein CM1200mP40_28690 [Gammaproteobacteria bacterium]
MAVKKSSKKAALRKPAARKTPAVQKKYTKTEILSEISANANVSKKEVAAVLDELAV